MIKKKTATMPIDEFIALARNRRSIRKFKTDPIPDECINQILEAAHWAMSGANSQPWQFIVVKKKETKEKLAQIYGRYREIIMAVEQTRLEEYRQPAFRAPAAADADAAVRGRFVMWSEAPVIIAVVGDRRLMQASTLTARLYESHTFDQNLSCAAYGIHLAAAALGLGAQWLSLIPPIAEGMKTIMGIPLELSLFNLNPLGYPDIAPSPSRRDLKELVHDDAYDMSKFMSMDDVQRFIRRQREQHSRGGTYKTGSTESAQKHLPNPERATKVKKF